MAKPSFTTKTIPNLVDKSQSWALCIGSGTSFPLFPMWVDLAKKIVQRCVPAAYSSFNKLSKKLSPEMILQAATDMANLNHNEFSKELAAVLYEDLFLGLSGDDENLVKSCLSSDPGADIDWKKFLEIIQKKSSGKLTAYSLAESLLSLNEKGRAPASILSFNAEMLFGSLLNAIAHEKYHEKKKFFDYIIEPTSYHERQRIPYYFCHGVMPIPGTRSSIHGKFDADDRLVFLENEYLQLANRSFSWQSSVFMNTLTSHTVFFVGLSFVDPNIRRWLAWIQEEKLMVLRRKSSKKGKRRAQLEDKKVGQSL